MDDLKTKETEIENKSSGKKVIAKGGGGAQGREQGGFRQAAP